MGYVAKKTLSPSPEISVNSMACDATYCYVANVAGGSDKRLFRFQVGGSSESTWKTGSQVQDGLYGDGFLSSGRAYMTSNYYSNPSKTLYDATNGGTYSISTQSGIRGERES